MAPGRCYRSSGGDNNGVTPNQRTTMRTSPGLDGWILLVSGPWNLLSVVGVIHWHKCGNSMIACSKTSHESGYNPCNINYGMSYTVSVHDCIYLSIELEQHRQVIHVFLENDGTHSDMHPMQIPPMVGRTYRFHCDLAGRMIRIRGITPIFIYVIYIYMLYNIALISG